MPEQPRDGDVGERGRLERTGFQLEFEEDFTGEALDPQRWIAHYLPHWTTPERSAARYDLCPGLLRLRIDADQPAWREADGPMRVSNLQTGTFSGPIGSPIGQHRHRPDLTVVTAQRTQQLYTPTGGLAEATMRATRDPTCMLAFWLMGFEASPEASGEICVAELFGNAIGPQRSHVRIGVKAHHDPRLTTDMDELPLNLDAADWHTYSAEWTQERIRFFVDDRLVRIVHQHLSYPLQLMVDLFEFPKRPERDPCGIPKDGRGQGRTGLSDRGLRPNRAVRRRRRLCRYSTVRPFAEGFASKSTAAAFRRRSSRATSSACWELTLDAAQQPDGLFVGESRASGLVS